MIVVALSCSYRINFTGSSAKNEAKRLRIATFALGKIAEYYVESKREKTNIYNNNNNLFNLFLYT